jgi:hypothetical protein
MKAGVCPRCGRTKKRQRPIDTATCDCYRYCPSDHGEGAYETLMETYTPENVAPAIYGPIKTEGTAHGDIEHPMKILYRCSVCNYHSSQQPVEVQLS